LHTPIVVAVYETMLEQCIDSSEDGFHISPERLVYNE